MICKCWCSCQNWDQISVQERHNARVHVTQEDGDARLNFQICLFVIPCRFRAQVTKSMRNEHKSSLWLKANDYHSLPKSTCASLIQLQWRTQGERTLCSWRHKHPVFHHRILKSLEIFELFIRHAFFPILLFVCVCCAVFWCFCCLLSSLWLIQGLHSFSEAQQKSPRTIIF